MNQLLIIIAYFKIMILLLRNRVHRKYLSVSVAFLNPYSTLGISPGASKKEVKNAYRNKAKECHPDLHPGDEKKAAEFIRVQEAYESIQNGTASSAGGSSESTSQRMRQQKSWSDRGFGSEQKQGFDFEHNYRQRMKARAEWERERFLSFIFAFIVLSADFLYKSGIRIKKEREARGDEHAYQHHARWSQDAGYGEYEKDFRHYQRNEFHGHRQNFKQYDYQSDEFRRRAQRVRENLHKNEQYAQHDQAYRDKQDEWASQRRAEFEKLFQTKTEDAVNESRAREQELKGKRHS